VAEISAAGTTDDTGNSAVDAQDAAKNKKDAAINVSFILALFEQSG